METAIRDLSNFKFLFSPWSHSVKYSNMIAPNIKIKLLNYASIIPDRYRSVPIFISDRPSVSIRTDFLRHDFRNGEGLERSNSESDTRRIG